MSKRQNEISELENEVRIIEVSIEREKEKLNDIANSIRYKQNRLEELAKQIGELERLNKRDNADVKLSDHALVRYMERKMQYDIESMKSRLLSPQVRRAIKGGAHKVKIDGVTFVVKGNTIVTAM